MANNDLVRSVLANGDSEYEVVAGSNREAEFSAYEEGRQRLLERAAPAPDVWVILNDRLAFYKADSLRGITPALLGSSPVRHPSQSGVSISYLATINFGAVNFGATSDPITYLCRRQPLIALVHYKVQSAPMSMLWRCQFSFPGQDWPLSRWAGSGTRGIPAASLTVPGGERWTRAELVSMASWPGLRMKALSIVNEWLLSLRLIEAQVPIVPWRLARAMSGLGTEDTFLARASGTVRGRPWGLAAAWKVPRQDACNWPRRSWPAGPERPRWLRRSSSSASQIEHRG